MFDDKYLKHLEDENNWLREQVEILQEKLFKATRIDREAALPTKPMKYDEGSKSFVEMSAEQINAEQVALQEILAQNV